MLVEQSATHGPMVVGPLNVCVLFGNRTEECVFDCVEAGDIDNVRAAEKFLELALEQKADRHGLAVTVVNAITAIACDLVGLLKIISRYKSHFRGIACLYP